MAKVYENMSDVVVPRRRLSLPAQEVARSLIEGGRDVAAISIGGRTFQEFLTEENPMLSFREIAAFFERCAFLSEDPDFGSIMGTRRDFRATGLAAYCALTAPTVQEFFLSFCRTVRCYTDGVDIQFSDLGHLVWTVKEPSQLPHHQYMEFLSVLLLKSARMYLKPRSGAQGLEAKAVWMDLPQTASTKKRSRFWGCPVQKENGRLEMRFQLSDLSRRMRSADPYLHRLMEDFAAHHRADEEAFEQTLHFRLKAVIYRDLSDQKLTQASVAQELGMSARSLSRELSSQDLRFFSVLDEIRREIAKSYLCDTELAPSGISKALGFASLSSFTDAFKRWFAMTPGQFRSLHGFAVRPDRDSAQRN
ncbi:AraC family transcriptional regulator [Epibacterium ulvae]|uniref:AraC family transcriptional regulator n=1 Tax=Epibacterium ulvae TaxID=1156985 RepID=UPI001BFC3A96|nr:AraC family transcriptional regulator [Epibacterium ulvae]